MWLRHHSLTSAALSYSASLKSLILILFSTSVYDSNNDWRRKVQSTPEKMESVSCAETISKNDKVCGDCRTSKTPLWRSGPDGPKSLCNACGIRYRKKKSVVGSDKKKEKPPSPLPSPSPLRSSPSETSSSSSTNASQNRETYEGGGETKKSDLREKLTIELVALGGSEVLLRRQRSPTKKVKRQKMEYGYSKFGEVEEAAFVLMSLSCGLVFA